MAKEMVQEFIDASVARSRFFELLNKVYMENKSFVIRKSGIEVAEIASIKKRGKTPSIMDFAGMWSDLDDSFVKEIYELRSDKNRIKRPLPRIK